MLHGIGEKIETADGWRNENMVPNTQIQREDEDIGRDRRNVRISVKSNPFQK